MKMPAVLFSIFFLAASVTAHETGWQCKEIARFKASEANQGVAVDETFFYAIGNREIGKYKKTDGSLVARWKDVEGGRFTHINEGVVKDGKLYGAHSNFPGIPMTSSVEVWDTQTLKPIESHDFGKTDGSLTSISYHEGNWYAVFAHYLKKGGTPGRGPEWTRVVKFDDHWQPLKEWKFPAELVKRFVGYSSSCAAFGPGGYLYATGHDAGELYVLQIPAEGATLKMLAIIPLPFGGQAFAWDPANAGVLYGINRKTREVVVTKIISPVSESSLAKPATPSK